MPFSEDWFSHNIPTLEPILRPFCEAPANGLEIGCFEGRSTLWLMENVLTDPKSKMVVIDTFRGSSEHTNIPNNLEARFDENLSAFIGKISKLVGTSARHLRSLPFDTFDFVYVDGSHKASTVLSDAVLSWPLLKRNGIMIFDDYQWAAPLPEIERPRAAIDAFMTLYADEVTVLANSYQMILRKS